jgi:serine/threonine protein kinase
VGQEIPHAFGTVRYSSPEMAAHSAGPASDVWSAGVLLCHVLTGRVPFLKDNDLDTLELIRKGPEVRTAVLYTCVLVVYGQGRYCCVDFVSSRACFG